MIAWILWNILAYKCDPVASTQVYICTNANGTKQMKKWGSMSTQQFHRLTSSFPQGFRNPFYYYNEHK